MTTSASEVSVCSHLFTVKGYTHTRGIGVGSAIQSPEFDAAGHRWSVVFYPDGDEQDSRGHISVCIRRVGGTGVASAPEASKAPKIASFGHSAGGESRGIGRFMEHQTFEESPYQRDDCFTIKCVIGAVKGPGPPPLPVAASELQHDFDRLVVDVGRSEGTMSDVD
ncbi:BTB/POZ and MATH domain-containing protein 4-like [Miscanthus floridulus]|uniref:BTB/POZ and MATH domain-containing protein 4-like n=1 Tax=Miscanthus floridulus TaxID=154761 RepID=UPI003457DDE7